MTLRRIFDRCGLKYAVVEAHSGAMGGSASHEFMAMTDAGEDLVASCAKCGYAANLEKATSQLAPAQDLPGDGAPEEVHTPGMKTIEEVAKFLGVSPTQKIKTLALMQVEPDKKNPGQVKTRPVIVLLRGDHTLNEAKLGAGWQRVQADAGRRIKPVPFARGYLGPGSPTLAHESQQLGSVTPGDHSWMRCRAVCDKRCEVVRSLVAGADKENYHLKNVTPLRTSIPTEWWRCAMRRVRVSEVRQRW
jgi:prolyl-tRNA synthetase